MKATIDQKPQLGHNEMCHVNRLIVCYSDATGLNHFNIKIFRLQHQMSGINIKTIQDCHQNLLCNIVPVLHIHHRFMKPSVWLIIAPSSCLYPIWYIAS